MTKQDRLKLLANENGVIAAMAIDQRGSLKKMLGKAMGKDATDQDMKSFKETTVEVLTPYASAVLLDPEYGLSSLEKRDSDCGVLLAYEKSGYDTTAVGRLPDLLDEWDVNKLQTAGADAIKLLVYYNPEDSDEVNQKKKDFIREVGEECNIDEMPFFLEIICYSDDIGEEKSLAFAKAKPRLVGMYMEEFSKPEYCVDVLKVEFPVNIKYVEGSSLHDGGDFAYTKAEALELIKESASKTSLPFIYLSAGVTIDAFVETLVLAREAGVGYNGVLCGRATWQDAVQAYGTGGVEGLRSWLMDQGVKNIERVNEELSKGARCIT